MPELKTIAPQDALFIAISVGEKLLINGAEVSRVEDTISRICTAFGAERVDVFSITSSIVVTMCYGGDTYTQTRRVLKTEYNMRRLELLNQLSRNICAQCAACPAGTSPVTKQDIEAQLEEIRHHTGYPFVWTLIFYALVSSAFAVFFGGDLYDAAVSAVIGALLRVVIVWLGKYKITNFCTIFIASLVGGLLSFIAVRCGLGHSAEMISIGNIMLLIPGIAMTNGVRDMFSGNMITGLLRLVEALLLAIVIALAFVWTDMMI